MALPGAAQCGRNPAHGALARDCARSADDCGAAYPLDGAGARVCVFAVVLLATDCLSGACGGGDVAGALPAAVDSGLSSGRAFCGHRMAGADLDVRDGATGTILSVLRVCDGSGGVSLGAVGDAGHGGCCGGAAVGGSVRGAKWPGASMAAGAASAPARCAGTGSATAVYEFGVSDCARIVAGLYVGEPEEGAGGARRHHARA